LTALGARACDAGMAVTGTLRVPTNLPAELTSFVGRRREIADVKALMAESRLVTVTGMGGVGKTRLARRIAASASRAFADGVWQVELADLHDPALLVDTIASALGLRLQGERWTVETLTERIEDRNMLVLLDNCEHLVDACAATLDRLLTRGPRVHVLVTSRETLGVRGERSYTLRPLSLPDPGSVSAESVAGNEAVSLFVDRGHEVCPTFAVDASNAEAVAELCVRLDGVPLALEMAAVWTRVLAPGDLLRQLVEHHELLNKGYRGAPVRQQSLHALVDWSYQLCDADEQAAWRHVSVFAQGFELDAVEVICPDEAVTGLKLIDVILRLVSKSIISVDGGEESVRYRMPEMIRTFGLERLRERNEEVSVRRAHLQWCIGLAERARREWVSAAQLSWFARMRRELPNIRSALEFSLAQPDGNREAVRLIASLTDSWTALALMSEGVHWLDRATTPTLPWEVRLTALRTRALLAALIDDRAMLAPTLKDAWDLARGGASESELAWLTYASALAALTKGDSNTARGLMQDAVTRFRALNDNNGLILALGDSAIAEATSSDPSGTEARVEAFLAMADPLDERFEKSYVLWARAYARWRTGDNAGAMGALLESLRLSEPFDDHLALGVGLELMAWITAREGSPTEAAERLGRAGAALSSAGSSVNALRPLVAGHRDCEAKLRAALGPEAFEAARDRGLSGGVPEFTVSRANARKPVQRSVPGAAPGLTPREAEVADLVAQGLTNKEIAGKLVLSQRTVETHVEHILVKLGFTSRAQVAVWVANRRGPSPET